MAKSKSKSKKRPKAVRGKALNVSLKKMGHIITPGMPLHVAGLPGMGNGLPY